MASVGLAGVQTGVAAERTAERMVRRRGSLEQGVALEKLGHAVEYLIDSRLFLMDGLSHAGDQEAIQVLMRLSRAVFAECPEVVPVRSRVAGWLRGRRPGSAA